jgi:hypothetical protein
MPKPEMKRRSAMCQYALLNPIRPVHVVKMKTAHQVTRTRPMRSDRKPARTPPIPIPSSV